MFTFLLVVQALVAALLVGVILVQQSEGGGLGMGGSPSGLMSARGAANFLTRATAILAAIFVVLSIALAVVATQKASGGAIDTSLARKPAPTAPVEPQPTVPLSGTPQPAGAAPNAGITPTPVAPTSTVPLAAAPVQQPVVRQVTPKPHAVQPRAGVSAAPPPVAATVPRAAALPSIPAKDTAPTPVTGPPANSN